LFAPFVLPLLLSQIIVEMGFYSQGVSKTIPFVRHYPTGLDAPVSPINLFVVAQYHLLIKGMRTSEPREQLLTLLVQPRLILLQTQHIRPPLVDDLPRDLSTWHPMASIVITLPWRFSIASSSGKAVISLLF
jgi:hypothetical protein